MSLPDRVKLVRKGTGMSQAEFAGAVGVHRSAIGQWENGFTKNLRADVALAMERISGYSASWIITGRGPQKTGAQPLDEDAEQQVERIYAELIKLPSEHRAKIEAEINFLASLRPKE